MAVTASDLVVYGSATMPTGDVALPGGAIDTNVKMTFTDMSQTTGLVVSTDGIVDDFTVTATGRDYAGSIVTDSFVVSTTLARVTGTSVTQFERILRLCVTAGSHTGIITIEEDDGPTFTSIGTMENGVNNIYRPFYGASSSASAAKTYFEKVFVKNNSASNALLAGIISESGEVDLGTDKITFDLSSSGNDNGTSSGNRLSPPQNSLILSGDQSTGFTNTAKNVVGTDLGIGSGQGIWLKMSLGAGATARNGSWVVEINGSTT